ncbi:MAG: hypothetical protein ACKO5P_09650 [Nodosilinea sp.]
MGIRQELTRVGRRLMVILAIALLSWTTWGCAKPTQPTTLLTAPAVAPNRLTTELAEVSPPETLVVLKQIIDAYTPQVRVLSPRPGEIVESNSVTVRLQVRGLPLFKDPTWQLGPHLQLFLDDQPYQEIYDLSAPIRLENLAPGTHTLRVFASRPWHESFKNQGAFDQRTFHIFAQTPQKEVSANVPLLTYGQPQGSYGAEPILLDFYLTNTPLHANAQLDQAQEMGDWRIRCTINGQSFVFDQWQPVYLKGFKPGNNWIQLELIDPAGNPIENRFNNIVRTIDYQPGGQDSLSKLVRGELTLEQVAGIIDPTYSAPVPEASSEDLPEDPREEAVDQTEDPSLVTPEPIPDPGEINPSAPLEPGSGEEDLASPTTELVDSPEPDQEQPSSTVLEESPDTLSEPEDALDQKESEEAIRGEALGEEMPLVEVPGQTASPWASEDLDELHTNGSPQEEPELFLTSADGASQAMDYGQNLAEAIGL